MLSAAVSVRWPKLSVCFVLALLGVALQACVDLGRPSQLAAGAVDSDAGAGGSRPPARPIDSAGASDLASGAGGSDPDAQGGVPDLGGSEADTGPAPEANPAPDTAPDLPPAADSRETEPPPDAGSSLSGPGATCSTGTSCASGNCVDGVCCASACAEPCHTCNAAGSPGTCVAEPAGTSCGTAACSNGVASGERRCDGTGTCSAATTTPCGAYACYMVFCGSACVGNADCVAPFTCSGTACVSPGLVVYWPLDEVSGTAVSDASGNGRNGSLIGTAGTRPQPSGNVAPVGFANPRSLSFSAADNQGVVSSPVPPQFKTGLNPELTFAAWFQTGAVETAGSDLIDFGIDYALRIKSDQIEWIKRKGTMAGSVYALAQKATTAHLDGRWHHLAGTSGATGMRLYLDGVQIDSAGNAEPPVLNGPDQIGVGHQPGNDVHEFTGQIDDVRIYDRALSAEEIANLARGNR